MLPFQQDSVTLWRQHDNVAGVSKTIKRTVPVVFKAARGSSRQFAVPLAADRSCNVHKREYTEHTVQASRMLRTFIL